MPLNPGCAGASDTAQTAPGDEARAVWNGLNVGLEVVGVPEEIPTVGVISSPAEIVPAAVGHIPRLRAVKIQHRLTLTASYAIPGKKGRRWRTPHSDCGYSAGGIRNGLRNRCRAHDRKCSRRHN